MNIDADLLELSGWWVYRLNRLPDDGMLNINGNNYIIIDVQTDNPQAMTVLAPNGKAFVIYQGTQLDDGNEDLLTDIELLTNNTPEQFDAAVTYLETTAQLALDKYNLEHNTNYQITHTAGNSLGGAHANYVAALKGLCSVTLDPAPMPLKDANGNLINVQGMNATNYIATTSPLYLASQAAGFDADRFPGTFSIVTFGLFGFYYLGKNHTGNYDEITKADGNTVVIGIDDFMAFSVWGNGLLQQGASQPTKISINIETMQQLHRWLDTQKYAMKRTLQNRLDPVYELIRDEKVHLFDRSEEVISIIESAFASFFQFSLDVEETCYQAKTLISDMKGIANFSVKHSLDLTIAGLRTFLMNGVMQQMFVDATTGYEDGFVERLEKHHEVIEHNLHTLLAQWTFVEDVTELIYTTLSQMDETLQARIDSGNITVADFVVGSINIPTQDMQRSTEFAQVKAAIHAKQEQLDTNFHRFVQELEAYLRTAETELLKLILGAKGAVRVLLRTKEAGYIAQVAWYKTKMVSTSTGKEGLVTEFQQKKQQMLSEMQELKQMFRLFEQLQTEVKPYCANLGNIIRNFKPYLNQALFSESKFGEVQAAVYTALGITENASLVFEEIWQRINETESQAITNLQEGARKVQESLLTLQEQLKIVAIN